MSARLMMSVLLFSLLLPGIARSETPSSPRWGVLLSGGGGLFAGRNSANRGGLLSAHLLLVTPLDLEVGLALQWGRTFNTSPAADLDAKPPGNMEIRQHPWGAFRGIAAEARYRFLRDRRVSPWVALRVGRSTSTNIDTDAFVPRLYTGSHLALAAGAGMDVRIHGPLGVTLSGYYQRCDINKEPADNICTGAGPTLVFSPHLRF
ncbi:hypothetical protein [Myxococcus sp. NMCA1]|uniref:hypothetical protein n=1 Tax=Myxococcus sp. NMCA1 TaxID=2996785 RepID=UPI0022856427|nr:hypothetical protein [Myxococcus sp. NMCA1]WAM25010.1 hypothetical protein OZ403_31450 [Myxococcus sp. NMCA1]